MLKILFLTCLLSVFKIRLIFMHWCNILFNWVKDISFTMKLGGQKGERLQPTTHCQLCTSREKDILHFQQEELYFTTPQKIGRIFACPATSSGNKRLTKVSQLETSSTLNSCFSPIDFYSKHILLTSSFFLQCHIPLLWA